MSVATVKHGFQPKITPEQYESAKAQYFDNVPAEDIAKVIGCNVNLLRTRFSRDGLPAIRARRAQTGRGERTRQKYGQISEEVADKLAGSAPKSLESLAVYADVAMKGAKVGSLAFGWGEQTNLAIIVAGDITGDPEQEAIDVDSSAEVAADGQHDEEKA
jgi:hypothetical protein